MALSKLKTNENLKNFGIYMCTHQFVSNSFDNICTYIYFFPLAINNLKSSEANKFYAFVK